MANAERDLRREAEAAKSLVAYLREEGQAEDADMVADTIEGETGLTEAVGVAIDEIDELEILEKGLEAKEQEFASRRSLIKARKDRIRSAIEQALVLTDVGKITLPTATVFVSKRKAGLIVQNEADIPSEFFVEQPRPAPKLDKKALLAALEDERTIPGATLDNGSVSLSIRRK